MKPTVLLAATTICLGVFGGEAQQPNDQPVTSRQIDQLRREIYEDTRTNVEGLFEYRNETGDLLHGLAVAIDHQFERWVLTPAEREIALLLLKGLSHKQVATVRQTTERTVRQQALAIYRKAGLSGRTELAAFFLEDLLLPPERGA